MSELLLAIAAALLLVCTVYQRIRISSLHSSVDDYSKDLEEEKLLRAAEKVINNAMHGEELAEKDNEIKLLRKALEGSERKRRELAARYWEANDD